MKRSERDGKVFIDWSQNNGAKTTVSPYSLRGRERPTVAAPRTWEELASADLGQVDYTEMESRIVELGDLMAPMADHGPSGSDRLARYRSMRDAQKTPEPVPASTSRPPTRRPIVRDPGAPRAPAALRLPAGAGRRAGQLGGAQGAADRSQGQPFGRADRRSSAGVRELRGRDPQGRVRRRQGADLGLGHLPAAQVARGQGGHRHLVRPARRRARRRPQVRADPHRQRQRPAGEELADASDEDRPRRPRPP